MENDWVENFDAAITVCDKEGFVVYMNDKAGEVFKDDGGKSLISKNLFDCHSPESKEKLFFMLKNNKKNVYTIEKNGVKKIIYQSPWYKDSVYSGFVELSMEIPLEMPHFVRTKE